MALPILSPLSLLHGIWVLWLVGGSASAAAGDDDDDETTAHSNSEQSRRTYFEIFIFSVAACSAPMKLQPLPSMKSKHVIPSIRYMSPKTPRPYYYYTRINTASNNFNKFILEPKRTSLYSRTSPRQQREKANRGRHAYSSSVLEDTEEIFWGDYLRCCVNSRGALCFIIVLLCCSLYPSILLRTDTHIASFIRT